MDPNVAPRDTAAHADQAIDWDIVLRIATRHLADFEAFARQVRIAAGLEDRR